MSEVIENKKTDTQSSLSEDGPWSLSFDELMKAGGRQIDMVKETAQEIPQKVANLPIWETPFEELKKLFTSRATKEGANAPSSPVKQAVEPVKGIKQGLYHSPEKWTPAVSKLKELFDNKLIQAESKGQHYKEDGVTLTTSPVGALGVSQIMPEVGKNPGYGVKPLQDQSEEEYRRFGFDLLNAYSKKYKGDIRKAVAAYNYGPGNVDKIVRQARKANTNWETKLPKETRNYLTKVLGRGNG